MTSDRTTSEVEPQGTSRRDVARHLLHPEQFRDSIALSRQPSIRNATLAGVQAGITAAIALPLFLLSPWSHLIGFASLGALVALFGRFAPARSRNRSSFSVASGRWRRSSPCPERSGWVRPSWPGSLSQSGKDLRKCNDQVRQPPNSQAFAS